MDIKMKFKRKMQRSSECKEIAQMVERMKKSGFPKEMIRDVLNEMRIRVENEMAFDICIDYETGNVKLIDFPLCYVA